MREQKKRTDESPQEQEEPKGIRSDGRRFYVSYCRASR